MPTALKSDSMPNVRASSGTIGTTNLPISGFRSIFASIRTNTAVVDALRPSVPPLNSSNTSSSAGRIGGAATTRRGAGPPSAARRDFKYVISSLVLSGR